MPSPRKSLPAALIPRGAAGILREVRLVKKQSGGGQGHILQIPKRGIASHTDEAGRPWGLGRWLQSLCAEPLCPSSGLPGVLALGPGCGSA